MLVQGTQIKWDYNGDNTTCVIKNKEEVVISKTVKRFAKDAPNKRLGRKLSFEKAMKLVATGDLIPKETRAAIWQQFRTTINQPVLNT